MQAIGPGNVRRIAQLDTLRGAAALLVVLHHSIQAYARSTADVWSGLSGHLDLGRMGVVIFFMISGFVIAKAVPGDDAAAAGRFWKHRFFRLYPPFWVSVAAAVIVADAVGASGCCVFVVPATPAGVLANLTMFPLRLHQTMLIGIYWTLELEMLFYALVTAIALARRTRYATMIGAAALLFVAALAVAGSRLAGQGASDIGKDQAFLALLHLSLMFSGAAVRCHWDAQATRDTLLRAMPWSLRLYYGAVAAFFAGVAAIKLRHGIDAHSFRVAATYLLAIAAFLACLRWFDGSRLGTFLGDRSYGLYLLHLPAIALVSLALAAMPGLHVAYLPFLGLVLVASLIAADLMRRFVERPAIRLGHRAEWPRRRRAEPVAATGGAVPPDMDQESRDAGSIPSR